MRLQNKEIAVKADIKIETREHKKNTRNFKRNGDLRKGE